MAMLSLELNRLLGTAMLDSDFLRRVLSAERAVALQGFKLSPEERSTILASQACTLTELSRELTGTLARADIADADAKIDQLKQALPLRSAAPMDIHAYVQRAVNTITSHIAQDTQYEDVYLQQIAS
jgi:hypothetical protein